MFLILIKDYSFLFRCVLSDALYQIRFPLMPVEDFATGPAQSGILTEKEIVSLFLYFHVNPKPKVSFIDKPRCCLTGREKSVKRFSKVENRWGYSGTSDRIRFSVNKRVFIVGLGLYGAIHGPSDYNVKMQVINTETGLVCGENDTAFSCDGTPNIFRVMFSEPIELAPGIIYVASATLKGADSYYGTKGQRKVECEIPDSKDDNIVFHFSYATGNNNGPSVEDGQIPEIIFYT
jgi:BTB/POZ domain-containing protein 1/2